MPKGFPDRPLQAVATNCKFAVPFGNCQTQPRGPRAIAFVKNRKHLVATAFRLLKDATKCGRIEKPISSPEATLRFRACYCDVFRCSRDRKRQCCGESNARPLARRRFNTRRPAFVAIRDLNPCVRARFRLLG
jgi:hypothetical protein